MSGGKQRALVTGGAGFIGSHIVDALLRESYWVRILDNLSTGFNENISHLKGNPHVEFLKGDVRTPDDCGKAARDIDVIFHEAAQINPALAVEKPFYDMDINLQGTLNILEAARRSDVKTVVFASTNVYGNCKHIPIEENDPIDLLSPYAAAKLSAEAYCIVYQNTYDVTTIRLRYTNVYGPRQRSSKSESGVIPIFLLRILNGASPIILGDGEQTRDFVYVSDVVRANLSAADKDFETPEVFNIGSGRETSINSLARLILTLSGRTHLSPVYGPPRAADFRRCAVSTKKAESLLGFTPGVSLEQGLKKTLEWWVDSESHSR